ncbi:hypothetical protein WJX82_004557 [Trebouxia sp. C0006]
MPPRTVLIIPLDPIISAALRLRAATSRVNILIGTTKRLGNEADIRPGTEFAGPSASSRFPAPVMIGSHCQQMFFEDSASSCDTSRVLSSPRAIVRMTRVPDMMLTLCVAIDSIECAWCCLHCLPSQGPYSCVVLAWKHPPVRATSSVNTHPKAITRVRHAAA